VTRGLNLPTRQQHQYMNSRKHACRRLKMKVHHVVLGRVSLNGRNDFSMGRKSSIIDRPKIATVSSAHIMTFPFLKNHRNPWRCVRAFKLVISKYGTLWALLRKHCWEFWELLPGTPIHRSKWYLSSFNWYQSRGSHFGLNRLKKRCRQVRR
jgi:hypothetical protein